MTTLKLSENNLAEMIDNENNKSIELGSLETTDSFKEAIKELQEISIDDNEQSKTQRNTAFSPTFIDRVFQFILLWFTTILLVWDIGIPIASFKTIFWRSDFQSTCDSGCTPSCKDYGDQTYDAECLPSPRKYGDTVLWFNWQFRQEFGYLFIILITIHVFAAWFACPSYIFQIFFTKYGSKIHKTCGVIILVIVGALWSCGAIAAVWMVVSRGFHPCAYHIQNYNNANPFSTNMGENTASSFPFDLYLQFCYDGALLNECLMHGIASMILRSIAFNPEFIASTKNKILRKWQAYSLGMFYQYHTDSFCIYFFFFFFPC